MLRQLAIVGHLGPCLHLSYAQRVEDLQNFICSLCKTKFKTTFPHPIPAVSKEWENALAKTKAARVADQDWFTSAKCLAWVGARG